MYGFLPQSKKPTRDGKVTNTEEAQHNRQAAKDAR